MREVRTREAPPVTDAASNCRHTRHSSEGDNPKRQTDKRQTESRSETSSTSSSARRLVQCAHEIDRKASTYERDHIYPSDRVEIIIALTDRYGLKVGGPAKVIKEDRLLASLTDLTADAVQEMGGLHRLDNPAIGTVPIGGGDVEVWLTDATEDIIAVWKLYRLKPKEMAEIVDAGRKGVDVALNLYQKKTEGSRRRCRPPMRSDRKDGSGPSANQTRGKIDDDTARSSSCQLTGYRQSHSTVPPSKDEDTLREEHSTDEPTRWHNCSKSPLGVVLNELHDIAGQCSAQHAVAVLAAMTQRETTHTPYCEFYLKDIKDALPGDAASEVSMQMFEEIEEKTGYVTFDQGRYNGTYRDKHKLLNLAVIDHAITCANKPISEIYDEFRRARDEYSIDEHGIKEQSSEAFRETPRPQIAPSEETPSEESPSELSDLKSIHSSTTDSTSFSTKKTSADEVLSAENSLLQDMALGSGSIAFTSLPPDLLSGSPSLFFAPPYTSRKEDPTGNFIARLRPSLGIEGAGSKRLSPKIGPERLQTRKIGPFEESPKITRVANPASNKMDTGVPAGPTKARRAIARTTCDAHTHEAIFDYVPEAREDKVVFRWCVYALWTTWHDRTTKRRVLHHEILDWIGCYRFDTGAQSLSYIRDRLAIDVSNTWAPDSHTRQIIDDGLPERLWGIVQEDLETAPGDYERRVYVLSGERYGRADATQIRRSIESELEDMTAPSTTARRIAEYMNRIPPENFSRFDDRIEDALEHLQRMDIDVSISAQEKATLRRLTGCTKEADGTLTGDVSRYKARVRFKKRRLADQLRNRYRSILHTIYDQHKPYYCYSRRERTDRIFSYTDSALLLPSELREILCEGLYDVDLKSAHLYIAAWLWDSETALDILTDDGDVDTSYDVWVDLMDHCRPLFEAQGLEVPQKGDPLYDTVKGGMKIMLYSTVYGMPASSIQAEVTKALKAILGPDVGAHLREHELIAELLHARDEKLQALQPGDVLEGPTGITIRVEVGLEEEGNSDRVGPKSALASLAQSYEQELMSVLIDVAEERDRFKPILWLHDGAACTIRYENATRKAIDEKLLAKRKELTALARKDTLLPAAFTIDEIERPDELPAAVDDRIAASGGGVVRLKEGEMAVQVQEDGQEGQEQTGLLLQHEHDLYRIADTYIRITDDGYTITTDPYPEEKIWQTNSSNPATTHQTTTEDTTAHGDIEADSEAPTTPVPGAETTSRDAASSPVSDTYTQSAPDALANLYTTTVT